MVFGLAVAAGLLAGVASLLAGEAIMSRYQHDLLPTLKIQPSPEDMRRLGDARLYSGALTFTTMGAFLGLALGLAGGLAGRSVLAGARAAFVGLVLGAASAAALALLLVSLFFKQYDPQSGDLVLPLFTHGAIWSALGGVGGLAFGLGLGTKGRWKATLVGGFLGAAAAAIIYEIVGAVAFATSKTDLPVSATPTTRALADILFATLAALGAALPIALSKGRDGAAPTEP
jgi:hypothetical protein